MKRDYQPIAWYFLAIAMILAYAVFREKFPESAIIAFICLTTSQILIKIDKLKK